MFIKILNLEQIQTMSEIAIVKKCAQCSEEQKELLICGRCKKVYYCGADCQKINWPTHKLNCSKAPNPNQTNSNPESAKVIVEQKKCENQLGLSQFGKLDYVGTGNFSVIFRGVSKKDNITYAIKQVQKAKLTRMRKEADLFMEKHCLSKLKECPYVIRLYRTFQDELHLFLQMECPARGELWEAAKTFGVISESVYKYYAASVIKAVATIHDQYDIVHRDLKPENILLNDKHEIKLIDFGTAKDLSRPDIKGSGNGLKGRKPFEHYVGTPNYMAPECIHNKASEKISDVYSLSGVLYFLKVGSAPFAGASEYMVFKKSLDSQIFFCPQLFSAELVDLITRMNVKEMKDRLSLAQVMKHPYFSDIDFQNLPSYEQALSNSKQFELSLQKHCSYLNQTYGESYKLDSEKKKQLYSAKILPYLQSIRSEYPDTQWIQKRIQVMKYQLEYFFNLREDNNIGFVELYKQANNIVEEKAEEVQSDEQKDEKIEQPQQRLVDLHIGEDKKQISLAE